MVNAKEFFSGKFLKAEICKGGEICEFLDAGTMDEIATDEGTKEVLNFEIRFDIGGINVEKSFSPNKSSGNIMCEAWGDDTNTWKGKRFKITLVKVNVFGKIKDSIVVEPIVATQEAVQLD